MNSLELRRKRALYRSGHRGTKEMDIVLGGFAGKHVPDMEEARLTAFEHLLALPDPDIDRWLRGAEPPEGVAKTVREIRAYLGLVS